MLHVAGTGRPIGCGWPTTTGTRKMLGYWQRRNLGGAGGFALGMLHVAGTGRPIGCGWPTTTGIILERTTTLPSAGRGPLVRASFELNPLLALSGAVGCSSWTPNHLGTDDDPAVGRARAAGPSIVRAQPAARTIWSTGAGWRPSAAHHAVRPSAADGCRRVVVNGYRCGPGDGSPANDRSRVAAIGRAPCRSAFRGRRVPPRGGQRISVWATSISTGTPVAAAARHRLGQRCPATGARPPWISAHSSNSPWSTSISTGTPVAAAARHRLGQRCPATGARPPWISDLG